MRVVILLLVVAGLSVGMLYYLGDEETSRGGSRRDGPRDRTARQAEERTGFLSAVVVVEMANGDPAGKARVVYQGPSSGETKTDDSGSARIEGLARGYYALRVSRGGELGVLQFDLRETTHLGTIQLAGVQSVHGRVYDADGAPLEDAVVEAIESTADGVADLARSVGEPDAVAARTTSDRSGDYELKLARGRTYAFRASTPGFAVGQIPKRRIRGAETIDFHLQRGAETAGRIVDEQGAPVAGAHVLVVEPGLPKAETLSSRDGTFQLHANPSGFPTLVVRAAGFAPYFQRNLRLPATELKIQLERGITVRLRVVDDEDRNLTLPGVQVIVDMESGFASGVTDGNGVAVVRNLPARRNAATGGDHVILWGERHAAHVHAISVPIPPSGELDLGDLSLGRGGSVSGKVVEEGSDKPVAGATVRAFGGLPGALAIAAAPTTVTGNDGTFFLEGVPLGATHILALHAEYEPPELARLLSGKATAGGGPLFANG